MNPRRSLILSLAAALVLAPAALQTVTLPTAFTNVLTANPSTHTVTLNRFDVVILQRPSP